MAEAGEHPGIIAAELEGLQNVNRVASPQVGDALVISAIVGGVPQWAAAPVEGGGGGGGGDAPWMVFSMSTSFVGALFSTTRQPLIESTPGNYPFAAHTFIPLRAGDDVGGLSILSSLDLQLAQLQITFSPLADAQGVVATGPGTSYVITAQGLPVAPLEFPSGDSTIYAFALGSNITVADDTGDIWTISDNAITFTSSAFYRIEVIVGLAA